MSLNYTTVSLMLHSMPDITSRWNASSSELYTFAVHAERIFDAKVAKRYSVPIAAAARSLPETICTAGAVLYYLQRRAFSGERQELPEWVESYVMTWELADEVAEGKLSLVNSDGGLATLRTDEFEAWSSTMDYLPTVTEDWEGHQVIDGDKIDDIRQDRDQTLDFP